MITNGTFVSVRFSISIYICVGVIVHFDVEMDFKEGPFRTLRSEIMKFTSLYLPSY